MKKLLLTVVLSVSILLLNAQSAWNGDVASGYAGGDGSQNSPYQIKTGGQLAYLAQQVNAGNGYGANMWFVLANNINLGGIGWTPIGTQTSQFKGSFDGKGFKVSNLSITVNNTNRTIHAGLFGYLGSYSVVSNVNVVGCSINVTSGSTIYAGAIAGYNYAGKIENCNSTGVVSASSYSSINSAFAGGIAGWSSSDGVMSQCSNGSYVSASSTSSGAYAGGVVGNTFSGKITNCYNTGEVKASGYTPFAGGIVGLNANHCNVINCYNTGNISCSTSQWDGNAGGIAGFNGATATIASSYNTGKVNSVSTSSTTTGYYAFAGGIAGSNLNSDYSVTDCYNQGQITASSIGSSSSACAGGIVGFNHTNGYSVGNCYNSSSVSAVAPNPSSPDYSSYSSYAYAGGIVGYSLYNTVTNCYTANDMATINGALNNEYLNGALIVARNEMETSDFVNLMNKNSSRGQWIMGKTGMPTISMK